MHPAPELRYVLRVQQTLGGRLRLLREALQWTQGEVSRRSADVGGHGLQRVEVTHLESGRNLASTKRIRAALARAFGVGEDELFDYLDGQSSLPEFLKKRDNPRKAAMPNRTRESDSALARAIQMVVEDGYGDLAEVRKAAEHAMEELEPREAETLGVLEWGKRIELSLRLLRRAEDPAAVSGMSTRATPKRRSRSA